MTLAAGSRLGPYEVLTPVGAGGMGEVYKARDTRLERTVAIKVLPEQASSDPDRRARFEREARAVSSLNHPHICTLHDVGRENGLDYLVMEYLEGESLAQRLERGPLPLEQVLRYGIEIAEALRAAHRQGVIHRDLKPGNVVLTKSGAKLLDFGLAKTYSTQPSGALSQLATGTQPLTEAGTVLGTFQYMAPEQLEGKEADARTDVWALGCVLYEMAAGKRPFMGRSQASLMAAILEHEPEPLSVAQPMSPPAFDRLVRKCLAKDPDERWDSAHDVADELKWIAASGSASPAARATPRTRLLREWVAWTVAALATLASIGLLATLVRRGAPRDRALVHLVASIEPAEQLGVSEFATVRPGRTAIALSPDGSRLAFSATRAGVTQLYVRSLDRVQATPLPGTEGGNSPVFSPDGEWVAFWADNKLKKVALDGSPASVLCEAVFASGVVGAAWREGFIVFSTAEKVLRVRDSGGNIETLTTADWTKEAGHLLPQLLPGGKHLLFTLASSVVNWEKADVVVQRLDNGQRRTLIPAASDARYVESGHLLYMKGGTLMAVAFDAERAELAGAPVPMLEGVMHAVNMPNLRHESCAGQYALSSNGTLAFVPGGVHPDPSHVLVWVDRRGAETPLAAPAANYWSPRISPDGRRLVYQIQRPQARESDIWTYELARGTPTRLTFANHNGSPVWSPDGTQLVFSHASSGTTNLHLMKADGTGTPERLANSAKYQIANDWSRAVDTIVFVENSEIWVLAMGGDLQPKRLLEGATLSYPAFSPDGRWLAYVSDESGRNEVYVRAYPGPGEKLRLSTEGGTHPAWAPDGSELFYRSSRTKMMAVAIDTRGGFQSGPSRLLWERAYRSHIPNRPYDVSPDGQRFLFMKTVSEPEKPFTQIHVILNWGEELKRRAAPG